MQGDLYRKISALKEALVTACGHLAAWADYPEEEIPAVESSVLYDTLTTIKAEIDHLLTQFDTGRLIRNGINTAIVGKPNVGKSTLMNLLAGTRKSIVTEIAGTTRDVIEESVAIDGVLLNLADTAGIRQTDDPIEQLGVTLSQEKLEQADLVLALFDGSLPFSAEDRDLIDRLAGKRAIALLNKTDLQSCLTEAELTPYFDRIVPISAKEEAGLAALTETIREVLNLATLDPNAPMLASERQRQAATEASVAIGQAMEALSGGITLDAVTISCEAALDALLTLTGERVTDAVVDQVFSQFCVGK